MKKYLWLALFLLVLPFVHGVSQSPVYGSSQTVLATGTATLTNSKLSLPDTFAFFDFSDATQFSRFATTASQTGETIEICNASAPGNCIQGVIGTVGTGEILSATEKLLNPSFDNNATSWTPTGCTIASVTPDPVQSNNCLEMTVTSGSLQYAAQTINARTTNGYLYKFSVYDKLGTTVGTANYIGTDLRSLPDWTGTSNWTNHSMYFTATSASNNVYIVKHNASSGTLLWDEASIKQVLTPSATGFWIRQLPSSTDGNKWNFKHASFNPNQSSGFVYRVLSNNQLGRKKAGGALTAGNVHSVIDDGNASITITGTDLSSYAGNGTGGTITIKNPHSTTAANWTINPYLIVLEDSSGRVASGVCGEVYNTTGLKLYSTPNETVNNMKNITASFDVANVVKYSVYRQY